MPRLSEDKFWSLLLLKSFQILQCIHNVNVLKPQSGRKWILPFYWRHFQALLDGTQVALSTVHFKRNAEKLIWDCAVSLALHAEEHYEKTIGKLVWELLAIRPNTEDLQFAFDKAVEKGRIRWRAKLSKLDISEFKHVLFHLYDTACTNDFLEKKHREKHGDSLTDESLQGYFPQIPESTRDRNSRGNLNIRTGPSQHSNKLVKKHADADPPLRSHKNTSSHKHSNTTTTSKTDFMSGKQKSFRQTDAATTTTTTTSKPTLINRSTSTDRELAQELPTSETILTPTFITQPFTPSNPQEPTFNIATQYSRRLMIEEFVNSFNFKVVPSVSMVGNIVDFLEMFLQEGLVSFKRMANNNIILERVPGKLLFDIDERFPFVTPELLTLLKEIGINGLTPRPPRPSGIPAPNFVTPSPPTTSSTRSLRQTDTPARGRIGDSRVQIKGTRSKSVSSGSRESPMSQFLATPIPPAPLSFADSFSSSHLHNLDKVTPRGLLDSSHYSCPQPNFTPSPNPRLADEDSTNLDALILVMEGQSSDDE